MTSRPVGQEGHCFLVITSGVRSVGFKSWADQVGLSVANSSPLPQHFLSVKAVLC